MKRFSFFLSVSFLKENKTPKISRSEYFALFAGLREGSLLPYSSHYLAETLYGRPLERLRETLQGFGIEIAPERSEPEDHAAILCEVMAGLASGSIPVPAGAEREFFQEHLLPWIGRFFFDLEQAEAADFYSAVGLLGRTFVDVEAEAFSRSAEHGALSIERNLAASNYED